MRDGDDFFALVTPAQYTKLVADGWDVQHDAQQTAYFSSTTHVQSFLNGYQTVDEIETFLNDMVTRYPTLTTLVDFGDSWERQYNQATGGHDLLALRITSASHPGPKPVFFLMAGIHAREIASTELAIRFIRFLLENYNVDPNVTWIVNEHEIVVAPLINPDGYTLVEQGYYQRKNTNTNLATYCTTPPTIYNQSGVDLNRNSSYLWGTIATSDIDPCEQTFPGLSAASEPETHALQTFISSLYPTHTSPITATAPATDTTGVLITMHSYAELVLWPWGSSNEPAPHADALQRLGQRFASYNDYLPQQAYYLYPTSGTTDDWSYATLGIASYTFEIGPSYGLCGGFMPPYACMEGEDSGRFWPRNKPALLYAAQVARAPYTQPAGPHITAMSIVSDTLALTLTATLTSNDQTIQAADAYIGTSPWHGDDSTTIALAPVDGAFDSQQEQARGVIPIQLIRDSGYTPDTQPVLVLTRGFNATDTGGPLQAMWFPDGQPAGPLVQAMHILTDTESLTLSVTLHDDLSPILAAEVYLGNAPWQGGTPRVLTPHDGAFDTQTEEAYITLSQQELRDNEAYDDEHNRILMLVRAQNTTPLWGQFSTQWISSSGTTVPDQPATEHALFLPFVMR